LNSDTERRAGFRQAMENAGFSVEPQPQVSGDGKIDGAAAAFRSFRRSIPTAVVCYNDLTAVGVMEAAKGMGLSIPGDISIVGFDDIQVAELLTPALTTVRQPKWELGMRSMSLILQILRGEEAERTVVLPGELVVRGSTAGAK
jgi:DNA-binding LacI/PurR family transcriptional regulator